MKLAAKLTITLILAIVAIMGIYAWVQISGEVLLSAADAQRALRNGRAWLGVVESVWEKEGEARARDLIRLSTRRAGVPERVLAVVPLDTGPDRPDLSADERRALDDGEVVRRIVRDAEGREWQHAWAAIKTARTPTAIEVVEPLQEKQAFIRMSRYAIVGATLAIIAVCALIVTILHIRLVGHPLALLRAKARRAGDGDFSAPLVLRQRDEMGDVAGEINAMCARIDETNRRLADESAARVAALEQLRHTERLATVGQLAAGVAHELGTPLNVVSARAELLVTGTPSATDAAANGRIILEQTDRMTAIIHQLLDFSRRRGPSMGLGNLEQVVTRTLDLVSPAATRAKVRVECATTGPLFARFDPTQMQQVLANVFMNGIQAMSVGGTLRVSVDTCRTRPPGDGSGPETECACVTVEDDGRGIARDDLARIFEPFFTTKRVGEGTGLGLAVAHGIVAEHGGWIVAESEVGKGSRFSIFLPKPAVPTEAAS
jgi:signal transduction histidine kinase